MVEIKRTDRELIEEAKVLAGGTQQLLAPHLGVGQTAISNWVRDGRIPEHAKQKVMDFIEKKRAGTFSEIVMKTVGTKTQPAPPDRLKADTEWCYYWAESAWCFNYIEEPSDLSIQAATDLVTRTFHNLRVLHPTTFRHYFRYQPFGAGSSRMECEGLGFLREWTPGKVNRAMIDGTLVSYLGAHHKLKPGPHGCGGYFIRAPESVLTHTDGDLTYEFVGFKPECPVRHVNLVLSIPRPLLGNGQPVAYLVSTDYPQYYDFGTRIPTARGDLDRLIQPWGRGPLSVGRLLPELINEKSRLGTGQTNEESWMAGWSVEDQSAVDRIVRQFVESTTDEEREVYHVRVNFPPPLMTLLLFWPLPRRS